MELPDFEDLAVKVENITALALRSSRLEIEIKDLEAQVFKTAMTNESLFQNGKPPSSTFIENAYKHNGINGEILPKRYELAEVNATLEHDKALFYLMKTKIEIWRSEQANQRASLI